MHKIISLWRRLYGSWKTVPLSSVKKCVCIGMLKLGQHCCFQSMWAWEATMFSFAPLHGPEHSGTHNPSDFTKIPFVAMVWILNAPQWSCTRGVTSSWLLLAGGFRRWGLNGESSCEQNGAVQGEASSVFCSLAVIFFSFNAASLHAYRQWRQITLERNYNQEPGSRTCSSSFWSLFFGLLSLADNGQAFLRSSWLFSLKLVVSEFSIGLDLNFNPNICKLCGILLSLFAIYGTWASEKGSEDQIMLISLMYNSASSLNPFLLSIHWFIYWSKPCTNSVSSLSRSQSFIESLF